MVTKRKKELKERIVRCTASIMLSDNTYTISQAKKIINGASEELRAMKKEKSLKDENDIT